MAKILITGVAGFIGAMLAKTLLTENYKDYEIIGVDNLNAYYSKELKIARLKLLEHATRFKFIEVDISNTQALLNALKDDLPEIKYIINLAAQAGVRYSLENPYVYANSNILGFINILELAKLAPNLNRIVYASSSSVYGANDKFPFSVQDRTDSPISLYAATKKSNELIAHSYAHLYHMQTIGLRYFTVYGPWGRPDMAAFLFADGIFNNKPIKLFNNGNMKRNFSYISDIIAGTIAAIFTPLTGNALVYNVGNNKTVDLKYFVELLENAIGKKAIIEYSALQPGDVIETLADLSATERDLHYKPQVNIEAGITQFINWYKDYYKLTACVE